MNKKVLIGGGISLLVVAMLFVVFSKKINEKWFKMFGQGKAIKDSESGDGDKNKMLSEGMTGVEVVALQTLIKADGGDLGDYGPNKDGIDGVFGGKTKSALVLLKGVEEITLNQYSSTENTVSIPVIPVEDAEAGARHGYYRYN